MLDHETDCNISLGEAARFKISLTASMTSRMMRFTLIMNLKVRCEIKQPVHLLQQQKKYRFKKKEQDILTKMY